MKIVYKRSLTFIGFLIIIISLIGVGYLFYDKVISNETLVVVQDDLSINYLDSSNIIGNGEFRFSVTNNGSNDINYEIKLSDISSFNSNVTYYITSANAPVSNTTQNLSEEENIVVDNIIIKPLETQNFILHISNNSSTTFDIEIAKLDEVKEYFYMTILAQNEAKESALTSVGEEISTTSEGLIKNTDDDGITYYFRGAATNNYVSFAGSSWRIIRINGDGSVRLIANDISDTLANYNTEIEGYEDLENADIQNYLTQYYESNLSDYNSSIATTKFCSESSSTNGVYNAYTRIVTNKIPTFNCLGERYTSKIGLLSADEFIYAGGLYDEDNTEFYLYNEEIDNLWWTSSLSSSDEDNFYPFIVDENGSLTDDISGSLYRSLRPVISLNRTVSVSGTGTIDDPYIVN